MTAETSALLGDLLKAGTTILTVAVVADVVLVLAVLWFAWRRLR